MISKLGIKKNNKPFEQLLKKISKLVRFSPTWRLRSLLIALVLVIGGQIIMHRTVPIDSWHEMRQSINDWLRIDAKYLGNVIIGMSCTILGGVFFAITTFKTGLFKTNRAAIFPIPDGLILKKFHFSKWLLRFVLGGVLFAILLIRAWKYELEFFDVFFWVGAIILFTSAVFRYDKTSGVSIFPNLSYREVGIIVLLVIAGLLIGTYQLQDIPNSMQGDEGVFFETARFIANGEYRETVFGFGVYSYPALSSFIQGAIMWIFGKDIWGWRFASLVPALLSVIPLYLLGRDIFNRWVGIISSLIYISSPYFLSFARLGYNNSQAIFFVTLCVWLFYQGLKRNSLLYMFLAGVVSGLGFLTYTAGRLGVVIILILLVLLYLSMFFKKGARRFLLVAFLVFGIGCALFAAPHLTYGVNHNPQALQYKLIEGIFINLDYASHLFGEQNVIQTSTISYLGQYRIIQNQDLYQRLLLRGLIRSLLGLQLDEFSTNFFLTSSLAGPFAVIFYVFGISAFIAHFWKPNSYPLLIWFFSGLFFLSIISTYPPRPAHLVPIIPVLALFSGLGVFLTVEQITEYLASKNWSWTPLKPILFLVCCLTIMIAGIREYFVESIKIYRPNLEQVINWAGLHNPPETDFFYIYDSDHDQDWVPYFYRLGLTEPNFESVHIQKVLNGTVNWPEHKNFAVFFEENTASELLPIFKNRLNSAEFITLRDRDGKPIGRAIVSGNVELSTSVTFWSGTEKLLTSRVMWLVLPLFAFGIILFKMNSTWSFQDMRSGLTDRLERVRAFPFLPVFQRSTSDKISGAVSSEPGNTIELGFFLRLRLPKEDRNFQAKIVLNSHQDQTASKD